jgi:hypothetical protein
VPGLQTCATTPRKLIVLENSHYFKKPPRVSSHHLLPPVFHSAALLQGIAPCSFKRNPVDMLWYRGEIIPSDRIQFQSVLLKTHTHTHTNPRPLYYTCRHPFCFPHRKYTN